MARKKATSTSPDVFTRFSTLVSTWIGRPWMFVLALSFLLVWAVTGPFLGFSETWQLVINTSTTIVTFLIVFIIQNSQNRDSMAINVKLDAIMEELGVSDDELLKAEDQSDKEIERKKKQIQKK